MNRILFTVLHYFNIIFCSQHSQCGTLRFCQAAHTHTVSVYVWVSVREKSDDSVMIPVNNTDYKVHEIKPLKKLSKTDIAEDLLKRLVQATSHVLISRKWRVSKLEEFFPKNASLLGININRSIIKVRLRYSHNSDSFYEWEDILGNL